MTRSTGATCRLSLPTELEAVRDTVALAHRFLAEQNLEAQDLVACELALTEACNNAVAYSRPNSQNPLKGGHQASVHLELFCDAHIIEMHVIDHGSGFEWPDQIDLPDSSEEHGRGLFIIKSLMQDVSYLRGRDQNRLIMRIHRKTMVDDSPEGDARQSSGLEAPAPRRRVNNTTERASETAALSGRTPPPEQLAAVQQKLALSEHVIGTMAKEICFRSEELAAIFRSTSELGTGGDDLAAFSDRLLNDLLQLASADWFVLRLVPKQERKLVMASASRREVALPPVDLVDQQDSAECKAALSRSDVLFGKSQPLNPADPLASAFCGGCGLVKPIFMGEMLLGTLAVGRNESECPFLPNHLQVIQTFSEFLAIQTLNIRLHQEHLNHRLTSRELDIARSIQESLLPKRFPKLAGYGLAGFCINARQVGGDFFDVVPLSDDKVLLVIADVMGKGVPAALFAATLHTLVRTVAEWTHRPAEILERVNRLIFEELSSVDMFITAQMAVLDARKRRLMVANAGHCPLVLTHHDGHVEAISPEGMPLGIVAEATFEQMPISLQEHVSAVLYTDGLTEARNAHGQFFGQNRFFNWLQQHHALDKTAEQLSDALRAELKSFQGEISLSDDQTFLVLAEQISDVEAQPSEAMGAKISPALNTPIAQ
jgi:serine phosphatase RsbU (regulator of sigma subunit)/anti-sigma regulatory factor (Ser/Thr protein kinase)